MKHTPRIPTYANIHSNDGQFRDANQPALYVVGLGEKTGLPRGNLGAQERTCKVHAHKEEAELDAQP